MANPSFFRDRSTPPSSFLAGAVSASIVWCALGLALASLRRAGSKKGSGGGDEDRAGTERFGVNWEEDDTASASRSIDDPMSSRIGELPSKTEAVVKEIPWPWDTIRRSVIKLSSFRLSSEGALDELLEDASDEDEGVSTSTPSSPLANEKGLCIGSIFGLDVGGTLAKLVYFEKGTDEPEHNRREHYHQAASARAVLEARRGEAVRPGPDRGRHSRQSELDLERLWQIRQASVPDKLDEFGEEAGLVPSLQSVREEQNDVSERGHKNGLYRQHSALPGMKKSRSMFDISKSAEHAEALDRFYNFARRLDTYETSVKDKHLSFYSRYLGGEFHFMSFETRRMKNAMDLIRVNNLHLNISEMGATGGGAHKYEDDWERILGIHMDKQEELDSLVAGMQFVLADVVGECYTFQPKKECGEEDHSNVDGNDSFGPKLKEKSLSSAEESSFSESDVESDYHIGKIKPDSSVKSDTSIHSECKECKVDEWWWSRKVQRDVVTDLETYPYLLVTIGTGVSILRVDGPRKHERISGSTIGGGTYWGLCRLLTNCESFEDVINLAERGDPSKVDMMVGDIYGQGSDALEKLGLPANLVASSFGKLVAKHNPAEGLKQEDLARALLLMVTNNIGQVAYLNAKLHKTSRIYFVGNFLRHNVISQQRLAFAINFWSGGMNEALFLEHEGYFGALGAFLLSQGISHKATSAKTHFRSRTKEKFSFSHFQDQGNASGRLRARTMSS